MWRNIYPRSSSSSSNGLRDDISEQVEHVARKMVARLPVPTNGSEDSVVCDASSTASDKPARSSHAPLAVEELLPT